LGQPDFILNWLQPILPITDLETIQQQCNPIDKKLTLQLTYYLSLA